jgi:hypothetical protein
MHVRKSAHHHEFLLRKDARACQVRVVLTYAKCAVCSRQRLKNVGMLVVRRSQDQAAVAQNDFVAATV